MRKRRFPWSWQLALVLAAFATTGCEIADLPAQVGNNVCHEPILRVDLPGHVEETSGVATSQAHAGVFWTHNDSGGEPMVVATDTLGSMLATVRIQGATNRDWEDIALGSCEPGATEDCLFIAEIGDNSERYKNVAIYRIPEPDPAVDSVAGPADILRFTYPDGPRDAESVFVTEAGIHVISKGRSGAIELFRLPPPYQPERTVLAERVQRLAPAPTSHSAQATAAAADPQGDRVVLRTYAGLRFFTVDGDTLRPVGRAADIVAPGQLQGEGVDFIDAERLVLTSEARGDGSPTLAVVSCDPKRPPRDTTEG